MHAYIYLFYKHVDIFWNWNMLPFKLKSEIEVYLSKQVLRLYRVSKKVAD